MKQLTAAQLHAAGMLFSGTLVTVVTKMQYSVRAEGTELCADPDFPDQMTTNCPFNKPWFGVLLSKFSLTLCLAYVYIRKAMEHRSSLDTPLLHGVRTDELHLAGEPDEKTSLVPSQPSSVEEEHPEIPLKTIVFIAFPSMLDLLQTVLGVAGLLFLPSSIYQITCGSVIVFSAFLQVKFLGMRLYAYHYVSIVLVVISVVLVGLAGTSTSSTNTESTANALFGFVLIISGQLIMAIQFIVEEYLMVSTNVSPMVLVGWEGLWGLLFYVFLAPALTLSPASDSAMSILWHEDFVDSFVKLQNSPVQLLLAVLSVFAYGMLGVTATTVIKHLSTVVRSFIESIRSLGVWVVDLLIVYAFNWRGANSPGEEWTSASWIELLGFILMVYGTLAYKKVIRIPVEALYVTEEREQGTLGKTPLV
ncbi:hypothetical protein Poli38472_000201 [Pythium oligandrum]|uniref:Solute carrier family 35 member F6 n=1 Tax=Pythium oligandrum TaxID=41045 RepID=A0A8K1CB84_PYTOL|nr:hypothetical protein Poli38472_000201 [Pythium oligandrum]|eukprot:TMW60159.1 hypothetical protein Poli38472_000201 [Pythium oligandrum]